MSKKILALFAAVVASIAAVADTQTWTGDEDYTWEGSNWDYGNTWTEGNTAVFPNAVTVTVASAHTASGFTFSGTGTTRLEGAGSLEIPASDHFDITTAAGATGEVAVVMTGGTLNGSNYIRKYGDGTFCIAADSTWVCGALWVYDGTLTFSGTQKPFGEGMSGVPGRIENGARLDVNGTECQSYNTRFPYWHLKGDGPDGKGAMVNTGAQVANKSIFGVSIDADSTLGVVKRYDIATLNGGTHTITKLGGDQLAVSKLTGSGTVDVKQGTYTTWNRNGLNNGKSLINVYPKAVMNMYASGGANVPYVGNVALQNGSYFHNGKTGGNTAYYGGKLAIDGTTCFNGDGYLVITSRVEGAGSIVQTGKNVYYCMSGCDFDGTLYVTNKTLYLGHLNCPNWTTGTMDIDVSDCNIHFRTPDGVGTVKGSIVSDNSSKCFQCDYGGTVVFDGAYVSNFVCYLNKGEFTLTNNTTWVAEDSILYLGRSTSVTTQDLPQVIYATLNISDGVYVSIGSMKGGDQTKANNVLINGFVISNVVNQTGGTFHTVSYNGSASVPGETDGLHLGHYGDSRTVWNLSGGTVHVDNGYVLAVAIDGEGWFNQSGGTVRTGVLQMNSRFAAKGYGRYTLSGGDIYAGVITNHSTSASCYLFEAVGGTIHATNDLVVGINMSLLGNTTFDSGEYTITADRVFSGEGGFTKTGTGTMALTGANTYTGATRLIDGTVAFSQAYPGGDIELPAAATGGVTAPLLTAPGFAFSDGKGVRVTEADTLNAETYGQSKTIVTSTTAIASVPSLTLVATDGTEIANDGKWQLFLADGGKSLKFGPVSGTYILLR